MRKLIITGFLAIFLSSGCYGCVNPTDPIIPRLNEYYTELIFKLWVSQGKIYYKEDVTRKYLEAQEQAGMIVYRSYVCKDMSGMES